MVFRLVSILEWPIEGIVWAFVAMMLEIVRKIDGALVGSCSATEELVQKKEYDNGIRTNG